MRPPTPRPSTTCWRCHHRLLYADELAQQKLLRTRLVRVTGTGTLWVQCATRGCHAWCVMTGEVGALVRAALGMVGEVVGCRE